MQIAAHDSALQLVARTSSCRLWVIVILSVVLVSGLWAIAHADDNQLLGLPPIVIPSNNKQTPEKIELGKKIFQDTRLSLDGKVSCASCHKVDRVFMDGLKVAQGTYGRRGTRNTPTLLNTAYLTSLFWEGRRENFEEQAYDPFVNPVEHGFSNHVDVVEKIKKDQQYIKAFKNVFKIESSKINIEHVVKALASFERTLLVGDSPFDRYYFSNNVNALPPEAIRGFEIFRGKAKCQSCHVIGESSAIFTDNNFHALGIGMEKAMPRLAELGRYVSDSAHDKIDQQIAHDQELAALGRFIVSRRAADIAKFRTPSLRNVALTAPYMHDGSVATLEETVDLEIYYRSLEAGRPLILSAGEKADLISFLRALTSTSLSVPDPIAN